MRKKPKTARQDTEQRKEGKGMDFVYCEAREQRINPLVCQANILKGKCNKTLLKCNPTRQGSPAEGKTDLVKRYCEKSGIDFITLEAQDEPQGSPAPITEPKARDTQGQLNLFDLEERKGR